MEAVVADLQHRLPRMLALRPRVRRLLHAQRVLLAAVVVVADVARRA